MISKRLIACSLLSAAIALPALTALRAQSQSSSQTSAKKDKTKADSSKTPLQPEDEGQRVFEQNCARCHTAPQGFSSRISGTIVRHMRVRANLSQHDEQALLRFFNP